MTGPLKDELRRKLKRCCTWRPRGVRRQYVCSSFAALLLRRAGVTDDRRGRDAAGYLPRDFNEAKTAGGAIDKVRLALPNTSRWLVRGTHVPTFHAHVYFISNYFSNRGCRPYLPNND